MLAQLDQEIPPRARVARAEKVFGPHFIGLVKVKRVVAFGAMGPGTGPGNSITRAVSSTSIFAEGRTSIEQGPHRPPRPGKPTIASFAPGWDHEVSRASLLAWKILSRIAHKSQSEVD